MNIVTLKIEVTVTYDADNIHGHFSASDFMLGIENALATPDNEYFGIKEVKVNLKGKDDQPNLFESRGNEE